MGRTMDEEQASREFAAGSFPSTHWSQLWGARSDVEAARQEALNFLAARYWKPVFGFVCRSGCDPEQAKDLTQQFFAHALAGELFGKADPVRGRFRNFLLAALKNFLLNERRAEQAQKRRPKAGLVSFEALMDQERALLEPVDRETPDAVFHRAWLAGLIQVVIKRLEGECRAAGKPKHFEIFHRRLVAPAFEGAEPPALQDLGASLGLSEKEAANVLLTARRAFRRLLREEIEVYAGTREEVTHEIRDLFRFLGGA